MNRTCVETAMAACAAAWLVLWPACPARGEEVTWDAKAVLTEADLGGGRESVSGWGDPIKDGERTYRSYGGKDARAQVNFTPWWKSGEWADGDVVLAVTYEDTLSLPVQVYGWTGVGGQWGWHYVGMLTGQRDGKWKQALLYVSRHFIRQRVPEGGKSGPWSIYFMSPQPVAVDKIEVVRPDAALAAEARRRIRQARADSIELYKKSGFAYEEDAETTPLGEVAAEDRDRGFIPYVRSWNLDVPANAVPKPAERGARPLRTYATPGEYEPLQVAAFGLKDVTISAAVTDLAGPGTLKAAADIEIRPVECSPIRVGGSASKKFKIAPVWLRGNEPAEVKTGRSQAWYVTVRVPADAKPGVYKGELTLSAGGAGKAVFPVEFKVLPFKLDKADHFARAPYAPGILQPEYIEDLATHGCNAASMWANAGLSPRLEGDKCVAAVTPEMDEYLKALKKAGFVKMVYFGGGDPRYGNPGHVAGNTKTSVGTPEFEKYYGQYWVDIRRLEKERGWPEMICCPFDEPVKSPAKVKNYLACYNAVKKVSPETLVFCVFMNRPWACKQLGKQADIWSCNGAFDVNAAEKARLAKEGVKVLFYPYTGCTVGSRSGATRYNAGFGPWKYDADAIYFWAYIWYAQDPFNALDGTHTDWTPTARDVDGVLYTNVGWEGWREGIDDRLYVETAIRLANEKGRKDILEKIAALKAAVAKAEESDTSRRTAGLDDFFMKMDAPTTLDLHRAEVVAMILDMLK